MRLRAAARLALGAVEEHEVDVGGDVQLRAAELAECRDRERRTVRRLAVARDRAAVGLGERGLDALLGERAHGREDLVEGREAVQVAMGERHHHPLAQPPEARRERGATGLVRERDPHFVAPEAGFRPPLEVGGDRGSRVDHTVGVLGEAKGAFERGMERLRHAASHGEALQ